MIKFESLLLRNTHRLVAIAVQCGEKARGGRRSWTLPSCSPWIRRFEHKCPDQSVYTPCSQMDNAQIDRVFLFWDFAICVTGYQVLMLSMAWSS